MVFGLLVVLFFLVFGWFLCGRGDAANQRARLKAEKMGGEKFQENFAGVFSPPASSVAKLLLERWQPILPAETEETLC